MKNSQIVGLDILRFLSAMWVLLYHLAYWAKVSPFLTNRLSSGLGDYPALMPIAKDGWLGVPFFFIISGFVIAYSAERSTPLSFTISRIVRLVPGMAISATLILLVIIYNRIMPKREALTAYLHSVFFLPIDPYVDDSIWTLSIEISFYFLVWLLLWKFSFEKIRMLSISIGLVSSLFWVLRALIETTANEILPLNRLSEIALLQHGLYFAIGVLLWLTLLKNSTSSIKWIAAFMLAGVLQLSETVRVQQSLTGISTTAAVPVISLIVFIIIFSASVRWNEEIHRVLNKTNLATIRTLGLVTYPLYLIHQTSGAYFLGRLISQTNNRYLSLAIVVSGCLVTAWLIATLFEPPLQGLIRNLLNQERRK